MRQWHLLYSILNSVCAFLDAWHWHTLPWFLVNLGFATLHLVLAYLTSARASGKEPIHDRS